MCKFRWLLRVLDRHRLIVPIKGGFTNWIPTRIYVTSCKSPEEVYSQDMFDAHEKVDQLLRRIDEVVHMTGPAIVPTFNAITENEEEEKQDLSYADFGF